MSLTDTARHRLWGCALATAASRSEVNVAMPHLRGKWSPTKAILRTLDFSCVRYSFVSQRLTALADCNVRADGRKIGRRPFSGLIAEKSPPSSFDERFVLPCQCCCL